MQNIAKTRRAKASDYPSVMLLFSKFVEQPDRYKNFDNDSFHKVINSKSSWLFVLELNNELIGFISFSKRYVVRYQKPIIEVEEFYIEQKCRRLGLGKLLMDKVFSYAKKLECQYVFLGSSKDRLPAHAFYKKYGFEEYAFHYRKKV